MEVQASEQTTTAASVLSAEAAALVHVCEKTTTTITAQWAEPKALVLFILKEEALQRSKSQAATLVPPELTHPEVNMWDCNVSVSV